MRTLILSLLLLVDLTAQAATLGFPALPGGGLVYKQVQSIRERRFADLVEQKTDFSCGAAALATILEKAYGAPLDEPYVNGKPSFPMDTAWGVDVSYPLTVPEGELWVMGDNRTNSQDSRYFGTVPVDSVTGKAVFTYWPVPRIGLLDS